MPKNLQAAFPHSAILQPLQGLIREDVASLIRFAKTIAANAGNSPDDRENLVCTFRKYVTDYRPTYIIVLLVFCRIILRQETQSK